MSAKTTQSLTNVYCSKFVKALMKSSIPYILHNSLPACF